MGEGREPGSSRIAVCSQDELRRDALAAYISTLPEFTLVGKVADGPRLITLAELQRPDIALIDGEDRPGTLAEAVRTIRSGRSCIRLVVAYQKMSTGECAELREAGVAAVVPYTHGLSGLLTCLRRAAAGTQTKWNANGLTARQRDILLLVASGHRVNEIAEMLRISPGTVENHKRKVYAKLKATGAAHAVARAALLGIFDNSPTRDGSRGIGAAVGRSVLAVVVGQSPVVGDIVQSLIAREVAVVREHRRGLVPEVHWLRSHRGPVVRVLVNPTAEEWMVGATLGLSAILVHDRPLDEHMMEQALNHGVVAVIHSDQVAQQLPRVLNLVVAGFVVMDRSVAGLFTGCLWAEPSGQEREAVSLTAREYDILRSISRNHTVRQTARELGIAVKTVENVQGYLFRKLGVHNRAAALAKAYSLGLLQPAEGLSERPEPG